jgi:phosphoribosyl-ATP pyrophosphohydrolase
MEAQDMDALVRHGSAPADSGEIVRLYNALETVTEAEHPRTARLMAAGRFKMAQKLMEEAGEVALEAARHRSRAVVRESADLIYQLVVLWRECGIAPEEVWGEMCRRADRFGIAEKPPKPCAGNPASSTTPAEGAS